MERLTIDEVIEHCKKTTKKYENLNGINTLETADISLSFIKENWEHRQVKEYLEELKRYRDLDEQGLLLRLPCEVGDTLYYISDGFIEPCTVETIFISDYTDKYGNCSYMAEIHFDREDCPYVSTEIYFTDIGKTVFLTQSEAEQKLKEMESD